MKTALLGLTLAAVAGAAVAQDMPSPPPGAPGWTGGQMRADTNGDGVVTRAEALAQAGERFDRMDANHDGKLTRDEMEQIGRRLMRRAGTPPPPQPQQ